MRATVVAGLWAYGAGESGAEARALQTLREVWTRWRGLHFRFVRKAAVLDGGGHQSAATGALALGCSQGRRDARPTLPAVVTVVTEGIMA